MQVQRRSSLLSKRRRADLGKDLLERGRHPPDALLHVGLARKAEASPKADFVLPEWMTVISAEDGARRENDLVRDESAEETLERGRRRQVVQSLGLNAEEDWRLKDTLGSAAERPASGLPSSARLTEHAGCRSLVLDHAGRDDG